MDSMPDECCITRMRDRFLLIAKENVGRGTKGEAKTSTTRTREVGLISTINRVTMGKKKLRLAPRAPWNKTYIASCFLDISFLVQEGTCMNKQKTKRDNGKSSHRGRIPESSLHSI